MWAGISAIGLGAGPLIGAVIVEYVGWSGVFLLNLPLGAVLIGVALVGSTTTPLQPVARLHWKKLSTALNRFLVGPTKTSPG